MRSSWRMLIQMHMISPSNCCVTFTNLLFNVFSFLYIHSNWLDMRVIICIVCNPVLYTFLTYLWIRVFRISMETSQVIRARTCVYMGLLSDKENCGLRMRRECRERFPRHLLQRKLLISNPGVHHGTCVTHVPWCLSGSLTNGDGENVPCIPGACATRNFTYLARVPWYAVCEIPRLR